jgi:hypothetical protein
MHVKALISCSTEIIAALPPCSEPAAARRTSLLAGRRWARPLCAGSLPILLLQLRAMASAAAAALSAGAAAAAGSQTASTPAAEPEPEPEPEPSRGGEAAEPSSSTALVEWKPTKHTEFLTSLWRKSMSETVLFAGAFPGPRELVFAQGGTGTGAVQWGSGRLLAHFIAGQPQMQPLHELGRLPPAPDGCLDPPELVPVDWDWTGQTVVELGAGLGLAATVVAMCGADIVTTDGVEDLIDQLQRNVDVNLGRRPRCPDSSGPEAAAAAPVAHGGAAAAGEAQAEAGAAVAMLLPWGDEQCTSDVIQRTRQMAATRSSSSSSSGGGGGGSSSSSRPPSSQLIDVLVVADWCDKRETH